MVQVGIDQKAWSDGFKSLRYWEPALARSFRREIKDAGKDTLGKIRAQLRLPPPDDQPGSVGTRDRISRNTNFEVSFTARSAGVRFRTRQGGLGNMIFGYNRDEFRHPVFGQDTRVDQRGRPYFGVVITKEATRTMVKRIERAIDDANKAIGARVF